MNLHLDRENFIEIIRRISIVSGIDADIIEKDYYVCLCLEELSEKQDVLKAYFKGGTSIYKYLPDMRRFSEDIDLTVRDDENLSKTQNKKKLEDSAKGYNLTLLPDKTDNRKGSIVAYYQYETVIEDSVSPLHRSGEIQVEATSFTESEPLETCEILPLIYKFANPDQQKIMQEKYEINPFNLQIVKLERTFIDKLFAAEKYYTDLYSENKKLHLPTDLAKHLYDIVVLYNEPRIKEFLQDKNEVNRIEKIRRREEKRRIGGVLPSIAMSDFSILNDNLDNKIKNLFLDMQNKYVLDEKYLISFEELVKVLDEIKIELS